MTAGEQDDFWRTRELREDTETAGGHNDRERTRGPGEDIKTPKGHELPWEDIRTLEDTRTRKTQEEDTRIMGGYEYLGRHESNGRT